MCDREDDKDAEQEPEEIGEETVRRSVSKGFIKSQGKTTTFSYPGPILPPDDSEDESSTLRRSISRIKASSKYLRCIQQFWPKFPRTHNAMSAATTEGRSSTKTSQPSLPAEIRSGSADYDAARIKTARGAVTTRPTEVAMQPSMDACAWIHQAQDRSWRQYVMRTPDAAMRTLPSHVYYPWQVFQRWRLRSPEGPLH